MELAKGAFYHIRTPRSSFSQALPTSFFASCLCFISLSCCPVLCPLFCVPLNQSQVIALNGKSTSHLSETLSLFHRGGRYPEGDEREGGGAE